MTSKVHVVFTGGTIGSTCTAGATDISESTTRQLLSSAPTDSDIRFTQSEPMRILSEDATTSDWSELVRHIASLDLNRLDAVVVAHGSDTLAWTAKALVYGLAGIPKPILLVGSDKPLEDPTANGPDNFRDALSFALSEKLPGIYVAWRNRGESTTIHLGSRLLPCDIHDDKFRSALGLHFGTVTNGEFRRHAVEGNPSRSHLAKLADDGIWKESAKVAHGGIRFESDLLVLPAAPGLDHRTLGSVGGWKAVVQLAYHSGTASSLDAPGSFAEFSRSCAQAGIPVVVGPCRHGSAPYASVSRLSSTGALFAPSMTESGLVAKIRWLLGTDQDLSELRRGIGFDLLPETNFHS